MRVTFKGLGKPPVTSGLTRVLDTPNSTGDVAELKGIPSMAQIFPPVRLETEAKVQTHLHPALVPV